MAKNSNFDSSEKRDAAQKSFGFIGLSALAHVGVLVSVLLAPSFKTVSGIPTGAQAGEELSYSDSAIADPAAPGNEAAAGSNAPTEVLLADADDANAVALPADQIAKATEAVLATEQTAEKMEAAEIRTAPTAKAAVAEVLKPTQPVAKSEKPVAAEKALKSAQASQLETAADSEVAIKQALEDARAKQDLAKADDTPQKLDIPEMNEATETANDSTPADETPVPEEPREETVAPIAALEPEPVTTADTQSASTKAAIESQEANEKPVNASKAADATGEEKSDVQADQSASLAPTSTQNAKSAGTTAATDSSEANSTATKASGSSADTVNPAGQGSAANGAGSAALTAPGATGAGTLGTSGGGGAKGTFGLPQASQIRDVKELSALPNNPKPAYPVPDKLAGKQGTAVLVGLVKPDGSVTKVMVEQSSGSRLMDQAAAQAFAKWKFQPGQSGYIRSPFQFQLVGSAKEIPARLRTQ